MRRIAFALGVVFGIAVLGAAPAGAGDGASAEGGSHLVLHDVFGLQTLELQNFGFNAKIKADGSADGWYTYREVDDGSPIDLKEEQEHLYYVEKLQEITPPRSVPAAAPRPCRLTAGSRSRTCSSRSAPA